MMRLSMVIKLSVMCSLAACAEPKARNAEDLPSVQVETFTAHLQQRPEFEEMLASVRSRQEAVLSPKVSGRIDKLYAAPGQTVKQGDLLCEIEAADIRARLDQALALDKQAQANLLRLSALIRQNAATQQDLEGAQAKASVSRAAVAEAETMLGYAKITAPFSGIVTRKFAELGDLAAPGKPILGIADQSALRLEAEVPEAIIHNIKLGDILGLHLNHLGADLSGPVSEIVPAANPQSRTFLIKVDLPPATTALTGQFGRVSVPTGVRSALLVPAEVVTRKGQLDYVFTVDQGRARLRLVRTGRRFDGQVEILAGLENGEQAGVRATGGELVDGQAVTAGSDRRAVTEGM